MDELEGVVKTSVGYTGGKNPEPTYTSVCDGDGHTEAVRIEFNPDELSYQDLLEKFWQNYVGPGGKAQYKTAIWCEDGEQVEQAKASLKKQQQSGEWMPFMVKDGAITIEKMHTWYEAEEYHQYHLFGGPCKE